MNAQIIPRGRPMRMRRLGVGLVHLRRGGGPVLISESFWRTVAGIWINTRWGCLWVTTR